MKPLLRPFLRLLPKQQQLYVRQWARAVRNRGKARQFLGEGRVCACCGAHWKEYMPAGDPVRPGEICLKCGCGKRQRLFTLFWKKRIKPGKKRVLHFAPEVCLTRVMRADTAVEYMSVDLEPTFALMQADITSLPYSDRTYDVVVCSHVLEHVPDDAMAMRELFRVLRPGGQALVMVPQDFDRGATYENPAAVTPEDRYREFGQDDHVRIYGTDFVGRLQAAGFSVEAVWTKDIATAEEVALGDLRDDVIYVCTRP
ncbi:MAG TPA: methyltransferase domain-containing protein [Fimbriimonadaceae bacterium]|nr:methyltransferase domain-containing protein [Fimbriimonadaceae bacterium]